MRHFKAHRVFQFIAAVALTPCALACSDDDGHRPPIGAPTGPVIVSEGGAPGSRGPNGSGNSGGDFTAIGGNGGDAFGNNNNSAGGANVGGGFGGRGATFGGADNFGVAGSSAANGSPFGAGGSAFSAGGAF